MSEQIQVRHHLAFSFFSPVNIHNVAFFVSFSLFSSERERYQHRCVHVNAHCVVYVFLVPSFSYASIFKLMLSMVSKTTARRHCLFTYNAFRLNFRFFPLCVVSRLKQHSEPMGKWSLWARRERAVKWHKWPYVARVLNAKEWNDLGDAQFTHGLLRILVFCSTAPRSSGNSREWVRQYVVRSSFVVRWNGVPARARESFYFYCSDCMKFKWHIKAYCVWRSIYCLFQLVYWWIMYLIFGLWRACIFLLWDRTGRLNHGHGCASCFLLCTKPSPIRWEKSHKFHIVTSHVWPKSIFVRPTGVCENVWILISCIAI